MLGTHKAIGVEGTEEVAKWVWDKGFAAVAGDAIAFEVLPPMVNGEEKGIDELGKSKQTGLAKPWSGLGKPEGRGGTSASASDA
jgi:hypothetical protein